MIECAAQKNGCEIVPDLTLTSAKTNIMRQLLLNILPAPTPSRSNWVAGHNGEALTAWQCWLDDPHYRQKTGCGFYLFGQAGSGKSHLLHASNFPYIDAKQNPALIALPVDCSMLSVDNVQHLDAEGQQILFATFNRLHAEGGYLLMAGEVSPKNLELREDLRTRIGYGLSYGLLALDDNDKLAALSQLAHDRQLHIGEDLIPYLIRHTPRDMGSLTTLLLALDRYSLEHQRAITLPLLRKLLHTSSEYET
jgi:DnaA-homolog protein